MYATMRVLTALRETRKRVITNLPLVLPRTREYLIEKYGEDFDVMQRVRILKPEETATFWRFFGQAGCELPDFPRHEIKLASGKIVSHLNYQPRFAAMVAARTAGVEGGPVFDVGEGTDNKIAEILWRHLNANWDGGILYAIDEAHEFFNARQWAETGVDALHYLSQHRKLGDEVLFITQHVRNVDTQLRRVAQDFSYIKNCRKMKLPILGGFFKAPSIFIRTTYQEEKTGSNTGGEPEVRTFTLDAKGVASCYETAAGVGIAGAAADKEDKPRGLPWWSLPVFFVLCFTGCIGVYKGAKAKAVDMVKDKHPVLTNNAAGSGLVASNYVSSWRAPVPTVPARHETNMPERIRITGHYPTKGGFVVMLSDGRTLREGVRFVGHGEIEYRGERFSF